MRAAIVRNYLVVSGSGLLLKVRCHGFGDPFRRLGGIDEVGVGQRGEGRQRLGDMVLSPASGLGVHLVLVNAVA